MRLKWLRCYFLKCLDLGIETSRSLEIQMGNPAQLGSLRRFTNFIIEISQSFEWTIDLEVDQYYIMISKPLHQTNGKLVRLVCNCGIGQRYHSLYLGERYQETESYWYDRYFTYDGAVLRTRLNQLGPGECQKKVNPAGFLLFMMDILRSSDPLNALFDLFRNCKQG